MTHWRCEQRGECKARIHTEGMDIVKRINDHLHTSDNAGVSCCEVNIGVKRRAQESQDSAHHIASESVQTVSDSTIVKLPKLDSLKRTIRRERVNVLAAPVQPASLAQLALPAEYQQTAKGNSFFCTILEQQIHKDSSYLGPGFHPAKISRAPRLSLSTSRR